MRLVMKKEYKETETVRPGELLDLKPLEVKVHGGNFDRASRMFRALVQKEKIISLYKEKSTYEKPSQKRRRKRQEAKSKLFEQTEKAKKPKDKKDGKSKEKDYQDQ